MFKGGQRKVSQKELGANGGRGRIKTRIEGSRGCQQSSFMEHPGLVGVSHRTGAGREIQSIREYGLCSI